MDTNNPGRGAGKLTWHPVLCRNIQYITEPDTTHTCTHTCAHTPSHAHKRIHTNHRKLSYVTTETDQESEIGIPQRILILGEVSRKFVNHQPLPHQ